nr:sulfotransferase ssu-1-like isoform X3 [Dermacentor andersoni]
MMATRPLTRVIEGMLWSYYFPEQCVRSALAYQPLPDDVFIVIYPKCGTTWLQYLVYNIYRYLYITRNPFDCCVSYYYHTKHLPGYCFEKGTFDEFFELFITGDVEFGDYFDHLLSWYAHRSDPNVLFLTYEELKRDTAAAVVKMAGFLGDQYAARLRDEPALVERILQAAALGNMKKIFNSCDFAVKDEVRSASIKYEESQVAANSTSVEELVRRPMTGEFVRKGTVGDWKGHFSPVQVQRMLELIRVRTGGSDVMDLWKDIDIPR